MCWQRTAHFVLTGATTGQPTDPGLHCVRTAVGFNDLCWAWAGGSGCRWEGELWLDGAAADPYAVNDLGDRRYQLTTPGSTCSLYIHKNYALYMALVICYVVYLHL